MSTTSGSYLSQAATTSPPSPTDATTSTSARMPSSSSRASRKTWLSSTRRIRIGLPMAARSLLGPEKQGVVRLAALLNVDLDARMRCGDPREQWIEIGAVAPDEKRQELTRLGEQPRDDRVGDVVEVDAARDGIAVGEAEPFALHDRDTVQLHVARRDRDFAGRDCLDRLAHLDGVRRGVARA